MSHFAAAAADDEDDGRPPDRPTENVDGTTEEGETAAKNARG